MTPRYYSFPGYIEAIQITRHLTSIGGQAVQYIARSCRLDGNNKHPDSAEDLLKAIDLLYDELFRIKGVSPQQLTTLEDFRKAAELLSEEISLINVTNR